MNLGQHLEAAKRRRHVGDVRAAGFFGVDQSTFTRWRKGETIPEADRADAIAEFCELSRADVLELLATARATRSAERTSSAGQPAPSPDASPSLQHPSGPNTNLEARLAALEASQADLHAEQTRAMSEHSRLAADVQRLRRELERVSRVVIP